MYDQAVVAAEPDHDGVARVNWSLGVQEAEGWQAAAYAVIRICLEESTELVDTVAPGLLDQLNLKVVGRDARASNNRTLHVGVH